ncbi:MAG: endonuclease/exonuclease/phosphatase family protein [Rhodospirillaceae bacterium]|nr:endonuclease/exonuclease/phosphatase family protein [Rhodospirillaceae bacterium]
MSRLRLMTFNVENMLVRFDFDPETEASLATLLDAEEPAARAELARTYWNVLNDEMRVMTALAIREGRADLVCLQEVESMRGLRAFQDRYLRRMTDVEYAHSVLIEGNDGRRIDVAVMSRLPFERIITHQALRWDELQIEKPKIVETARDRIFKRDCLEVHVQVGEKTLPVFVCHFKSMDPERDKTRPWRAAEAMAVRRILERRFADPAAADWIVVGDLNDYTETDGVPDHHHALAALLGDGFAVDLVKRIADPRDRWTHFFPEERTYRQIDYLLASPALARKNPDAVPTILRQGQPYRAERYQGPRYPRIGWDRPKASDHCPVVIDLKF